MTLRLNGSTSGYVEIDAPAVAGTSALTLPTGTGTLATQASVGLVKIVDQSFTAASSISIDNCFTSAYDNYRILWDATNSANNALRGRLRVGGVDATGSNYVNQWILGSGTSVQGNRATDTGFFIGDLTIAIRAVAVFDLFSPQLAQATNVTVYNQYSSASAAIQFYAGTHSLTTAYDGMTFYTNTGTVTGTLRIYGYQN